MKSQPVLDIQSDRVLVVDDQAAIRQLYNLVDVTRPPSLVVGSTPGSRFGTSVAMVHMGSEHALLGGGPLDNVSGRVLSGGARLFKYDDVGGLSSVPAAIFMVRSGIGATAFDRVMLGILIFGPATSWIFGDVNSVAPLYAPLLLLVFGRCLAQAFRPVAPERAAARHTGRSCDADREASDSP